MYEELLSLLSVHTILLESCRVHVRLINYLVAGYGVAARGPPLARDTHQRASAKRWKALLLCSVLELDFTGPPPIQPR